MIKTWEVYPHDQTNITLKFKLQSRDPCYSTYFLMCFYEMPSSLLFVLLFCFVPPPPPPPKPPSSGWKCIFFFFLADFTMFTSLHPYTDLSSWQKMTKTIIFIMAVAAVITSEIYFTPTTSKPSTGMPTLSLLACPPL